MENTGPKLALPTTKVDEADAANPHIEWKQLITDFQQGGLTPPQYAAFGESTLSPHDCAAHTDMTALGGIFVLLLIVTTIIAIHSTRRAHAIEAEASNAAIGRWRDTERDIVKTLPVPIRRERLKSGGGAGGRMMGHIKRFSEDGRMKKEREKEMGRGRSASTSRGRGRPI